jgi:hypothetical protein
MLILRHLRLELLLLGKLAGCYFLGPRVWAELHEFSPTRIDVDRWDEEYSGQRWIEVHGRAMSEMAVYTGPPSADAPQENLYAHVPIVAADFNRGDKIHCIACMGPDGSCPSGEVVLTGFVTERSGSMFSSANLADDVIFFNVGDKPNTTVDVPFFLGCAIGAIVCIVLNGRLFLRWRAGR